MNAPRPNPYVGPRAFEPHEKLYGRDRELRLLMAQFVSERIVLLHSPSGAGKTSLIQAGLLPLLQNEKFNILPIARVNLEPPITPNDQINFNRYTLSVLLSFEESLPAEQRKNVDELANTKLDDYLSQYPRPADAPRSDVIVFDQFEEILTINPTDREGKLAFFSQLGAALRNNSRWALFAIREDYLGALAPFSRPIPNRFEATFRLDLLGHKAAKEAIQMPAKNVGIDFTDPAASKLVDDLRMTQVQTVDGMIKDVPGLYVEPVQLQVVCYRLWETKCADDLIIDLDDLDEIGSVDKSLADYYAQTVKDAASGGGVSERAIREWFKQKLISAEGIRKQVLMGAETSEGLDNRALRVLQNAHIVRSEKRAGATWFELCHDRMIEPITKDNLAWSEEHLSVLQRQAELWVKQGRPNDLLLRGKQLKNAELEGTETLNQEELEFLAACQQARAQEQRERRRMRLIQITAIVASLALVVAIYFMGVARTEQRRAEDARNTAITNEQKAKVAEQKALDSEQEAKESEQKAIEAQREAELQAGIARTGQLAFLADLQKGSDHALALLLGVSAVRNQAENTLTVENDQKGIYLLPEQVDSTQTRVALFDILQYSPFTREFGHSGRVTSVAYNHDGTLFASAAEGEIILWDASDHQPILTLPGKYGQVLSLAFSPDSSKLVAGGNDNKILVWDLSNLRDLPNLKEPTRISGVYGPTGAITSLAFNPDGTLLASASRDQMIMFWNVETGYQVGEPVNTSPGSVNSLVFSPDGSILAAGRDDWITILWDVTNPSNPTELRKLRGHTGVITDLAFNTSGSMLASASRDTTVRLWEVANGQSIGRPLVGHSGYVSSVAFNPQDDNQLASGGFDEAVIIWDINRGQPIGQPLLGHSGAINSLAFRSDGRTLASGSDDKTIILWDLFTRRPLDTHLNGHASTITDLAISSDGKLLVTTDEGGNVLLWEVSVPENSKFRDTFLKPAEPVRDLAIRPGGDVLAFTSGDKITIWSTTNLDQIGSPVSGHAGQINDLDFSSDGKFLASASDDGTVMLWDVTTLPTPRLVSTIQVYTAPILKVAFNPKGDLLATTSTDFAITLWDLTDPSNPTQIRKLTGHNGTVNSLVFNPSGNLLASASDDQTVILWAVQTAMIVGNPISGHSGPVNSVSFSPDGKLLASASDDQTVMLWNVLNPGTVSFVQTLRGHNDPVQTLAFYPGGKFLVSAGSDKTVILWNIDLDSWMGIACQAAGRNFTPAEWEEYFPAMEYKKTCEQWP